MGRFIPYASQQRLQQVKHLVPMVKHHMVELLSSSTSHDFKQWRQKWNLKDDAATKLVRYTSRIQKKHSSVR